MTPSQYYTYQFYTWEQRTRGWYISDCPIHLEPPFMPFFRHGYNQTYIDEGKRHTIISRFFELFKEKKAIKQTNEPLNYEEVIPYVYEIETDLKAIHVKLPKERKITPERMKALLTMLSYAHSIVSFEIIGTQHEIIIQFVGNSIDSSTIETNINAYFPDCTVVYTDTFISQILPDDLYAATIDFGLHDEIYRPLQIPKNYSIDPLTSLFGILEQLQGNQQAGIQILFQGTSCNWGESIVKGVTLHDGKSFFDDDSHAPKSSLEKIQSPLFAVTIRAFAQSKKPEVAFHILEKLCYAIVAASASSINTLIPLATELYDFDTRISDIYNRTSHRMGMLLNVDELSSILHFPSESIVSQKLYSRSRKTVEAPLITQNKVFVLGENYHNGTTQKVTCSVEDRLKHTHIIGATGTGKSTLIANLILQDITSEYGVILFDPHGDLVDDVISIIPSNRLSDVVLIDPSDTQYSVGLNILQAHSEIEKEVLSGDLVASFKKLSTSWGDQMNSVFGNAIVAMLENKQGGSLHDLRRFLIETEYRNSYLKNVTDPHIVYYWQKEYPLLKSNSIGSILTRLDTFLRPKSIRNMVIQKHGLDFESLLNSNKIILLKLSQGLIGTENSFLLGSLFLSKIHQAILRRQQTTNRNPSFMYLDEFQNFITPSIKEMLSGIRKYNVGLTISHQDLQQLQREDTELLNSVLGNINNRIVFRVGEPDAKRLQDGFSHFTFTDLQNQGRGEAVVRIEQPQYDCSLETYPFEKVIESERIDKIAFVTNHTRTNYATSKQDIEQIFLGVTSESSVAKEDSIQEKPIVKKEKVVPTLFSSKQETVKKEEVVDVSVHRYLQTLVKKMAEQRGYVAGIEIQVPNGNGQVDVLLTKETKMIAIEICNTTNAEWEMHNISKCIEGKYDTIVSLSGDPKQLERIRKKCEEGITDFKKYTVHFFTPDALFVFLDDTVRADIAPKQNVMKGYRVNVSYDTVPEDEMERKRVSIANVVLNSLKKKGK